VGERGRGCPGNQNKCTSPLSGGPIRVVRHAILVFFPNNFVPLFRPEHKSHRMEGIPYWVKVLVCECLCVCFIFFIKAGLMLKMKMCQILFIRIENPPYFGPPGSPMWGSCPTAPSTPPLSTSAVVFLYKHQFDICEVGCVFMKVNKALNKALFC